MSDVYAPPAGAPEILHADHALVAVVKPAGLLTVPGKGPELADCLLARLAERFPEIRLVHRLDRDTSGVMIFARGAAAQRHLGLQFEKRGVKKIYVARVAGVMAERRGEVDLPLIVDWPNRPLQKVCHKTGRSAQTSWSVIRRDAEETRVRLFPRTGRSHQLRVHMLSLGHPILGDPLYAPATAGRYARMMLHAEELRLRHPDGGAPERFRAPVPF